MEKALVPRSAVIDLGNLLAIDDVVTIGANNTRSIIPPLLQFSPLHDHSAPARQEIRVCVLTTNFNDQFPLLKLINCYQQGSFQELFKIAIGYIAASKPQNLWWCA
jgi:hypothetical protein